jgi:hypothetical protein
MTRLFEMKLRRPREVRNDIRIAFEALRRASCAYNSALSPNAIGQWPGDPGPREDGDTDLQLLECMKAFIKDSIEGHIAIKTNKHPFDDRPDSKEYDGCDGPYGCGWKRPDFGKEVL